MAIWKGKMTVEDLNKRSENTLVQHLGIEFTEIGDDYLKGVMPVDHRTVQPAGILHGGASLTLAESLGSIAGFMCIDREKQYCVGMEINGNHIRPARPGRVYGVVKPIHIGRKTHVWEITITNQNDKLVCVSRITLAILNKDEKIC
ncbi:MAG: hotdog fold thioesterase [Dissulfurispiraceae bacterium]